MKKLEKMYDIIFKDEVLSEYFLNFHSSIYNNLPVEEKKELLIKINERLAALYGYRPLKLIFLNSKNLYGSQNSLYWNIVINTEYLKNYNGYETIDTYFHELRHAFQHRASQNQLMANESASKEQIKEWKTNFLPGNYFNGDSDYYKYQPVEKDAWSIGLLFARAVYLKNREKIKSKDSGWDEYCNDHKSEIVELISENEQSRALLEKMDKEIKEIYGAKTNNEKETDRGLVYVREILENKSLNELSFKEVGILLSPFAFIHLDYEQKVALINRYYSLLNLKSKKKFLIKENTIDSIKINKGIYALSDPHVLVNSILSYAYGILVSNILKNKDAGYALDKKAIEELKLNLYRNKKGKKINFISDLENLFLYSLQPFARYESFYILQEFKKLKDIEFEAYGSNYEGWKGWETFYDNEIIYKQASQIMGMPFEKYYNNQLKQYLKRIKEDQKLTKSRH